MMLKTTRRYIDKELVKQVKEAVDKTKPIRTKSRNCLIIEEFLGRFFEVYNGKRYIKIYINSDMIRLKHKLGMYSPTKKPVIHSSHRKNIAASRTATGK